MIHEADAIVIGAGVVGLAVARALAGAGRQVLILEAESAFGTATSSRNSEVVHAGLYYPTDSLKARLCVQGREALYAYCELHNVGHRRCGKLVVATRATERQYLEKLQQQALTNGVDDVRLLTAAEMHALEPAVDGVAALLSPSTGIIDSHQLMLAYLGDAEAAGAFLSLNSPVVGGRVSGDTIVLETGGDDPVQLQCNLVVNAAGLRAWDVARSIQGLRAEHIPPRTLVKGSYFSLSGRSPFSRLVYPVPEADGLGVHLTLDLAGRARFGPDVEPVAGIDYDVDPARAGRFHSAIRRYWPGLPDGRLQPAYSGIRPRAVASAGKASDFVIARPPETGHPAFIALYGIESPGLTASLAIASLVLSIAEGTAREPSLQDGDARPTLMSPQSPAA